MRNGKTLYLLLAAAAIILIAMIVILITQGTGAPPQENPTEVPAAHATSPIAMPVHSVEVPDPGEPAGVVYRYLTLWGERDEPGMQTLLIQADSAEPIHDLELVASTEILSIETLSEAEAKELFHGDIYDAPAAMAMVRASFILHYNEEGQDFFLSPAHERTDYTFWLVKENENGNWRIAMQGY